MKRLAVVLALVLLAGCTTMGDKYAPPPPVPEGKARVYFLRSSVSFGNFWTTVFSVNDTEAVSLYDKGYSWIHLDPGTYKFAVGTMIKQEYLKFDLPVRAGREYYIEYNQEPAGYQRVRNVIRTVEPNFARALMEQYSYKAAPKADFQPPAR